MNEEDLPRELEREDGVFQLGPGRGACSSDRQEKLDSLGPINHLALEEYDTKKERLDFLEKQRDDVEKARDDLVKAITEINRTARKRFLQTFEEVRRNYIAVFQTLFKGGRADLQLIKTDDPLESHIHVDRPAHGQGHRPRVAALGRRALPDGAVAAVRGLPGQALALLHAGRGRRAAGRRATSGAS